MGKPPRDIRGKSMCTWAPGRAPDDAGGVEDQDAALALAFSSMGPTSSGLR